MALSKCCFESCKRKQSRIIGDCAYCKSSFCTNHRLPEDHVCPDIDTCRKQQFDKNGDELMKNKIKPTHGLVN